jgi:hypothetical protein
MIIRGDASKKCQIMAISYEKSNPISQFFIIELRAANLHVNLDSFPTHLFLGSPFSISCKRLMNSINIYFSHPHADVVQDDTNSTLGSLSAVPISFTLVECQHDVFIMQCLTDFQPSGIKRCETESFLGFASHNSLSLVSERGFFPASSSTCKLSWRMYDEESLVLSIIIFERILYSTSSTDVLFPNSQEIHFFGNNFLNSLVIYPKPKSDSSPTFSDPLLF